MRYGITRASASARGLMLGMMIGAAAFAALLMPWSGMPTVYAGIYDVQPGDTLSGIAQNLGITVGILRTLNSDIDPSGTIYVGQRIAVPDNVVPRTETVAGNVGGRHTVAVGDTLSEIAIRYHVTLAELLAVNPRLTPDLLYSGSSLLLPANATTPAHATAPASDTSGSSTSTRLDGATVVPYRVQAGDTYSGIAAHFGTTVAQLSTLNPSVSPASLRSGALIFVPRANGLAAPTPPLGSAPSGDSRLYVVTAGESASAIAARFGLTMDKLRAANPGLILDVIYVGQMIQLPLATTTIVLRDGSSPLSPTNVPGENNVVSQPRSTYTVRPDDTATAIAAAHAIPLAVLAQLNPSINVNLLFVGAELVVPKVDIPPALPGTVPAGAPAGLRYTVQPGDTLTDIAAAFATTVDTLLQLNTGLNANLLGVGQNLRLPGTAPIPTASRTIVTASGNSVEYVAARLGILPHTLLANNPALGDGSWIPAGTTALVPDREGVVVQVRAGDTLSGIAAVHGSTMETILADPGNGVLDPNQLVIGQELIVPVTVPAFIWPVFGDITDGFGVCRTGDCSVRHRGTDISQHETPGGAVVAIAGGTITFAGGSYCCGLGLYVEIEHGNGWISRYAHLATPPPVSLGQQVGPGETIGYSGTTGFSTGVHLHLELEHNGWLLDALNYLP